MLEHHRCRTSADLNGDEHVPSDHPDAAPADHLQAVEDHETLAQVDLGKNRHKEIDGGKNRVDQKVVWKFDASGNSENDGGEEKSKQPEGTRE